jgi:glycosyltransferase involved in cell wall biosynthesis
MLSSGAKKHGGHSMEFVFCPVDKDALIGDKGDFQAVHPARITPLAARLAYSMASRPMLHAALEAWIVFQMRTALADLRRRKDFDAVHYVGTGWDLSGFAFRELAGACGMPFTVCPFMHPESWGDDKIDVRLYRSADAVFCQSSCEADHLVNRGVDRAKVVTSGLPPAVAADGNGISLRERLGIGGRPAVFFMGRRDEGKGYPALLKAWPLALSHVPEAVLLLAGKGGDEYAHLLHNLPADSFRDLGIIDESTKADALDACDVFCLPSAHESFGIVYVEAWSYGKPVICGTAPACRELVENGMAGLHATQEPRELATQVLRLLENPTEAKRMGGIGRRLQQEKFTMRRLVDVHIKAWQALGSQSHASRRE